MEWLMLVGGIACAALGGELFVRGSVGIARWLRIAPGIVGVTIAAFSTSSPELSVSVNAAMAGKPQIGLGDALGSNVVNVALVLGLALAVSGIRCSRGVVRRDFPVAAAVPAVTGALLIDGVISRLDGALMLVAFAVWLAAVIVHARKERSATPQAAPDRRRWLSVLWCGLGLGALMAAGTLIVTGAKAIAASFGIPPFVIGATVVAFGTSAPELATTLIAKLRGHDDIGLGTILGSNLFNGLLIVGVAATIRPIAVDWREVAAALGFGVAALLLVFPTRAAWIPRWRGAALLALYAGYVAVVVLARPA